MCIRAAGASQLLCSIRIGPCTRLPTVLGSPVLNRPSDGAAGESFGEMILQS